jgi:hypothetical protein
MGVALICNRVFELLRAILKQCWLYRVREPE